MKKLEIKKLHPSAAIPTRATAGSAGYDLYACLEKDVIIPPGEIRGIGTGLAAGLDDPCYGIFVYARSGLATKFGIVPANCVGVVDSDYRGELKVFLINQQKQPFTIHHGDRIAQMVVAPVVLPELVVTEELSETGRGTGGFGSSGV